MSDSLEKLSSGSRINKSADDAAGLAISENLRAKTRGLNQARRNANDGISLVQVTEGNLNELSNMMIRMRELTVQAASDTIGDKERGYLQKEYSQLVGEIDRIGQSAEFNGLKVLGPEAQDKGITVQVGYTGSKDDRMQLQLGGLQGGLSANTLGIGGTSVTGSREDIAKNLESIDRGLDTLASSRATLGSMQVRLNSTISNIGLSIENMATANSRIRDVDFAEETAKLTQSRILSQAGLSVLAQANQRPEMALQLLR